ncbi:MAG: DUF4124 domain-containing protein [Halomonas sp.]|nr:DUF4124 domain-containing protein [Halomonas sp.]
MNRRLSCLLLGLVLTGPTAWAATVYRSVDEHGNVVFSDQPTGNGERIRLAPLTVVPSLEAVTPQAERPTAQAADPVARRAMESHPGAPFMPYSTFRIAAPENGQTLPTGYGGDVQVMLDVDPDLREDHRVRLLLDGEISQSAMHTKAFILTNLDRGEHVLQAELLDASGQVRHRSAPVILYVHRASVNAPANPTNLGGLPLGSSAN